MLANKSCGIHTWGLGRAGRVIKDREIAYALRKILGSQKSVPLCLVTRQTRLPLVGRRNMEMERERFGVKLAKPLFLRYKSEKRLRAV